MKQNSIFFRFPLFIAILLSGAALDLWTKTIIFQRLGQPGERDVLWIIPDILGFQTSLNQGALFGIGQELTFLFAALSVVVLLGIIIWVFMDSQKSIFLTVILGLISAGIIGNLWDRLALHQMLWNDWNVRIGYCSPEMIGQPIHAVRDWILVMIGTYSWPNFNLADSFLVIGAILIGLYSFWIPSKIDSQKVSTENLSQPQNSK